MSAGQRRRIEPRDTYHSGIERLISQFNDDRTPYLVNYGSSGEFSGNPRTIKTFWSPANLVEYQRQQREDELAIEQRMKAWRAEKEAREQREREEREAYLRSPEGIAEAQRRAEEYERWASAERARRRAAAEGGAAAAGAGGAAAAAAQNVAPEQMGCFGRTCKRISNWWSGTNKNKKGGRRTKRRRTIRRRR